MKNTRYYTGKSESVGSFILEGYTHKFENGTLTVIGDGGKENVYTNVVAFESSPIKESDSDKIIRLSRRIEYLTEQHKSKVDELKERNVLTVNSLNLAHDKKVKDLEYELSIKNKALTEIKELCYDEDIPVFGKRKLFEKVYDIADRARHVYPEQF